MCSCSINVVMNASIRVKSSKVANKTPGTAGASCLPVSSSKLKANNSSAASISGAGAREFVEQNTTRRRHVLSRTRGNLLRDKH